jgi:hypothetical protein
MCYCTLWRSPSKHSWLLERNYPIPSLYQNMCCTECLMIFKLLLCSNINVPALLNPRSFFDTFPSTNISFHGGMHTACFRLARDTAVLWEE